MIPLDLGPCGAAFKNTSRLSCFPSCDQHHMLNPRGQSRLQVRFPRSDGAHIMTQVSDSTCMAIYSIAVTLLALSWVYIPA